MTQARFSGGDDEPFENELLNVIEVDADERMTAVVVFEADDFDAALRELDARYAVGEAAPHATTWSLIAEAYATLNAGGSPPFAADYAIVDHRLQATIEASEFDKYMHASRNLTPDLYMYVESVHRLSDDAAAFTHAARGTSQDGFTADWRIVDVLTIEDGRGKHCELFDEADLDKALARYDELRPCARKLENAASRMLARFLPHFASREWDAMAEMLTEDVCLDDRRRIINAGVVRGRETEIANLRAIADAGVEAMTSTPVATRGDRLVLHRLSFDVPDWPEEQHHEMLEVVEVAADGRALTHIAFDIDDFDAAVAELDARYMAGEASPSFPDVVRAHPLLCVNQSARTSRDDTRLGERRPPTVGERRRRESWRRS